MSRWRRVRRLTAGRLAIIHSEWRKGVTARAANASSECADGRSCADVTEVVRGRGRKLNHRLKKTGLKQPNQRAAGAGDSGIRGHRRQQGGEPDQRS